jgi:hypothetical protein
MKRFILVLMVLFTSSLMAQVGPSFDDIATGTGKFSDGTAAAPSITFGSDTDTGIYRYGANSLGLGVSGSYAARVASSGNILIAGATDDGVSRLQVDGNVKFGEVLSFRAADGETTSMRIHSAEPIFRFSHTGGTADTKTWDIRHITATGFEGLQFRTVNDARDSYVSRFVLRPNGNVIIGAEPNTDTGEKLQVNGFTKLGDAATGIKMKVLTGTTAAAEGGTTSVAHGVDFTKIVGFTAHVYNSADAAIQSGYTGFAGLEFYPAMNASLMNIDLSATNSGNILSKPFVFTIWYVE